jgi:polyisoprenoid-binding protein YceI
MSTATAVRTFAIDQTHSDAAFHVRHLISKVRGRFTDFEGTIAFDESEPAQSTVRFVIHATSVDTNTPDRDAHLRSDDFFAVETYPTIAFQSARITPRGGNTYLVAGTLTMRGVSKAIEFPVAYLGKAVDPWGNEKIAFEGELTLNRKDYGLSWNAAVEAGGLLVGDEVTISLNVQAAAEK